MTNTIKLNDLYSYESNRALARIRHQDTAYDKYDVFFNGLKKHRQRLNKLCRRKQLNHIDSNDFDTETRIIIADVNLYKKRNQKRFIRSRRQELVEKMPFATDVYIKQVAKHEVWQMIKKQNKRNEKRNRQCNG